jgi:hypothetical protein
VGTDKLSGKEVPKSTLDGWSAESRDLSNDGLDFNRDIF